MAFSLKLPKFGSKEKSAKDEGALTVSSVMPSPLVEERMMSPAQLRHGHKPSTSSRIWLPRFMTEKPIETQIKYLGLVVVVLVLIAVWLQVWDNVRTKRNAAYLAGAGEMQTLSQRLARVTPAAVRGDATALAQFEKARFEFSSVQERLRTGGVVAGVNVPPVPRVVWPYLGEVVKLWRKTDANATAISGQRDLLVTLGKSSAVIQEKAAQIQEFSEQLAATKLASGDTAEAANANKMVTIALRMIRKVFAMQAGAELEQAGSDTPVLLSKDAKQFRDLLISYEQEVYEYWLGRDVREFRGLLDGFMKTTQDAQTKDRLARLDKVFNEYATAVASLLKNATQQVQAQDQAVAILKESDALLSACDNLSKALDVAGKQRIITISLIVIGVLALALLLLMIKLYLDDSRRRAEEAEKQRLVSETTNRENQDAILRLMNELGDLADGDLTVTATVSENITGAIADSINYTIEELRVLVGRINDAATRVTAATEIARKTSAELIDAAEKQSSEIEVVGRLALDMSGSMTKVSGDANESAQVARQSLTAAENGMVAVQDSIKGMNEIRGQIQETSKRIKRLGESSQEIGEIVELISDITEQTNVLALNAAIQAASAGEAGRGFTVVAEEVQRLAERSAEATKQIAAIVKTIQTDTQDAVSAMEESTRGVVEGAKLSDAAGQALSEIGEVSRNLAQLIQDISRSTQEQADSASNVANIMQDILHITEQTSTGTQRTAEAVEELNSLAAELKGSVAGFKVG
ncbi:MAG: Methyl-accepting chemotaxis protein PctA [Betaproteobacteria bacterium ADurb.Bin341]|nr:MAG: Methyl-accepting chemotaxis protein PctA [Betaproteobacteria bacterium ADurb.Bin341]